MVLEKNMITANAQKTKDLLSIGKVLRATLVAREAKECGDNTPTQIIVELLGRVAKDRAEKFDALPHDTFKCPHSH